jgi:nucleotide-binding universal stress UspA family protein
MADVKSILLHVDARPASVTRLQVAIDLAVRLDARLTAVFGATWDESAAFAYSAGAALDAGPGHAQAVPHAEARLRLRRHRLFEAAEVGWCEIVGEAVTPGFLAEAIYADLLVVGQQAGAPESGAAPAGFVESAILQSGRPTLVVPLELRQPSVGRRAVVAWNGSVQSVRALSGALPLLRAADEVHVATWTRHAPLAPFSRIDIREFLGRHGIEARIHQQGASAHVAADLAALTERLGGDLVVMGCYGHSRAAERVFGGTTRSVLAASRVAVLMAH